MVAAVVNHPPDDRWALGGEPSGTKPPPRLVLMGEPGIGKTTFGASAPNVVFVPTEDGALGVRVKRVPAKGKCATFNDVLRAMKLIRDSNHDYQWVALDTINGAESLCADYVCERDFGGIRTTRKGAEGYDAFGRGDKATAQELRQLLIVLDDLQQQRGMGVILLAHVGLHKQGNALGADFHKFGAEMNKHSWALTCAWADQVGYACRDMRTAKKEGEKFAKASAIGNERYIVFEGGPGLDAKSRAGYEMPERILLSWEEYEAQLGADPVDALVIQATTLLRATASDTRAKVAAKLGGGTISDATLREIGQTRLETLIGSLIAINRAAANEQGE